jgi:hypothetical protein
MNTNYKNASSASAVVGRNISAAECEFLAENELIYINPTFKQRELQFISVSILENIIQYNTIRYCILILFSCPLGNVWSIRALRTRRGASVARCDPPQEEQVPNNDP